MESTGDHERAVPSESIAFRELAEPLKMSVPCEENESWRVRVPKKPSESIDMRVSPGASEPQGGESTEIRERADIVESAINHERVDGMESTEKAERAVIVDSTDNRERVA
jgi:hypothetical protein